MSGLLNDPMVRTRLLVAAALAVLAVVLCCAMAFAPDREAGPPSPRDADVSAGVARAVDTLLARYGVDRSSVTTWRVSTPDRRFSRTEQRVFVAPQFSGLGFNHDLALMVAPLGVRVIGTERVKEQIVTLHLVSGGVTIRTVSLVTRIG